MVGGGVWPSCRGWRVRPLAAGRGIAGAVPGRNADSGSAFARQAFQVVTAEVGEERARRGGAGGRLGFGCARPPAVGAILRDFAAAEAVQRGGYLRLIEPQFGGDLLR